MNMAFKAAILAGVIVAFGWFIQQQETGEQSRKVGLAMKQLDGGGEVTAQIKAAHAQSNNRYAVGWVLIAGLGLAMFSTELRRWLRPRARNVAGLLLASAGAVSLSGCWRPFEPVQLETISTNEEAFLLPFNDDLEKQSSTSNEEYLKANLVYTKQVRIPQQWVPTGYETLGPRGKWQPAAILVKVDKSPVTREWTADPNSGTSNKNEAIWVMTSDQVEFSTGWTCTARIAARDDAVKFLHNYPNGSLQTVLDTEVRAKLQAVFGLEVTDLPMEKLRKEATPHITTTTKTVEEFFKERGITITNLGISGGFIYKDKTIMDTMVKVFNAEQEKAIATAEFAAQEERNKTVFAEAEGKAKALQTEKKAEADAIKLVADAKSYEIDKAKEDGDMYIALKRIELEREKLRTWDGKFPLYYMGTGNQAGPDLLLQVPALPTTEFAKKTSSK